VAHEQGSAALEFITAGLVLLVPTVYLVVALASIQGAQLAVAGASRQAARVYVAADSVADADAAASAAVTVALADFGLTPHDATVDITCAPRPDACHTPRGTVTVTVAARAVLPLMPDVLDLRSQASIVVASSSTQQVSRWRASP
jgi:hypothetical protein